MEFEIQHPPIVPSLDQQRDALQKGLGRAKQWALSGHLSDTPLLEACLKDKRFDQQCENSRGDWLWEIVQQVGALKRLKDSIMKALSVLSDERSANQLCELACQYAKAGDEQFRSRLYEIVDSKLIAESPWLGEKEIVELDGEDAILFITRIRGKRLATLQWEWDDGSFIYDAVERFGEERIASLLTESADTGTRRFYENWREQAEVRPGGAQSHQDRMRCITEKDIIESAKGENNCYSFRGWGMYADESALMSVLDSLWEATDPKVIGKLLRVFSNRSLPEFDSRLIDLCKHHDEDVQRWAFNALAKNSDSAIRKFALEQLEIEATGAVIKLFVENFECGDEERILTAMELPEDPDNNHWMLMDVIKVLENNPESDCFQLGNITYRSTPCENCRYDAFRLLSQQGVAPPWMIEECRFDSNEQCRELAEKADER